MEESSHQSEIMDTEKQSAGASYGEEADLHNQEPSPNSSKVDTSITLSAPLRVDDDCLNF